MQRFGLIKIESCFLLCDQLISLFRSCAANNINTYQCHRQPNLFGYETFFFFVFSFFLFLFSSPDAVKVFEASHCVSLQKLTDKGFFRKQAQLQTEVKEAKESCL